MKILSNNIEFFSKGYKTALNTENPPYYAHFNFNKQLTSLHEAINHKVEFYVQLKTINNNMHAYMHTWSANWW